MEPLLGAWIGWNLCWVPGLDGTSVRCLDWMETLLGSWIRWNLCWFPGLDGTSNGCLDWMEPLLGLADWMSDGLDRLLVRNRFNFLLEGPC